MAKDHGPQIKNDKKYEDLREHGMSKKKVARIANTKNASKKGGKAKKYEDERKPILWTRLKRLGSKVAALWTKKNLLVRYAARTIPSFRLKKALSPYNFTAINMNYLSCNVTGIF